MRLTGSNPLSTQDDVAAGLADMGVETFGIHGAMGEEYENLLIETLKFKPHLVVDDGGDLIHLLDVYKRQALDGLDYPERLRAGLARGLSFPAARQAAVGADCLRCV